mgnify:CR=1 FL=1
MKNIIKIIVLLAFISPSFALASVSYCKPVIKTVIKTDPKLQAQIDTLLERISILTKENSDLKAQKQEQTPVVSIPMKPVVNVILKERLIKDGNPKVYSYPYTLVNTSDTSVTISQIDFQMITNGKMSANVGQIYQIGNDIPVVSDGITSYTLSSSITINAHQSATIYINVWGFNTTASEPIPKYLPSVPTYISLKRFVSTNNTAQFNF